MQIATCIHNLGIVHSRRAEFAQALELLREALEMQRELGRARHAAESLGAIARVHTELEQHAEALESGPRRPRGRRGPGGEGAGREQSGADRRGPRGRRRSRARLRVPASPRGGHRGRARPGGTQRPGALPRGVRRRGAAAEDRAAREPGPHPEPRGVPAEAPAQRLRCRLRRATRAGGPRVVPAAEQTRGEPRDRGAASRAAGGPLRDPHAQGPPAHLRELRARARRRRALAGHRVLHRHAHGDGVLARDLSLVQRTRAERGRGVAQSD